MAKTPESIRQFLKGAHIAVAGVSRQGTQPANLIFRKLRDAGYDVFPVNPQASEIEGVTCYADIRKIPGQLDGVVIATPPNAAADVVRQCAESGIKRVWFHRSFGQGSVSDEAVRECESRGIDAIVGGCPMMFVDPVDVGHKCMRWWLQHVGSPNLHHGQSQG